ncbi:hypothetical protein PFISCL1PPCAC_23957, partial [Pristionchus fissidentatus]
KLKNPLEDQENGTRENENEYHRKLSMEERQHLIRMFDPTRPPPSMDDLPLLKTDTTAAVAAPRASGTSPVGLQLSTSGLSTPSSRGRSLSCSSSIPIFAGSAASGASKPAAAVANSHPIPPTSSPVLLPRSPVDAPFVSRAITLHPTRKVTGSDPRLVARPTAAIAAASSTAATAAVKVTASAAAAEVPTTTLPISPPLVPFSPPTVPIMSSFVPSLPSLSPVVSSASSTLSSPATFLPSPAPLPPSPLNSRQPLPPPGNIVEQTNERERREPIDSPLLIDPEANIDPRVAPSNWIRFKPVVFEWEQRMPLDEREEEEEE